MSGHKKDDRSDLLSRLLDFADSEVTNAEAEAELREQGVDVDSFQRRLRQHLAGREKRERLQWRTAAREKMREYGVDASPRYANMNRAQLQAALLARQDRIARAAFHHKLKEMTEDDLRSMLADLDSLADTKANT